MKSESSADNTDNIALAIITAVLGPLVVGLVIWWLGRVNEDKRVKSEAIRELMTYRGDYSSPEFRRALNKVSITFNRDGSIRTQIRELYETINNPSSQAQHINRKIVGVIYSLCQKNGFNQITEYDIDQSFPEAKQTPQEDSGLLSISQSLSQEIPPPFDPPKKTKTTAKTKPKVKK